MISTEPIMLMAAARTACRRCWAGQTIARWHDRTGQDSCSLLASQSLELTAVSEQSRHLHVLEVVQWYVCVPETLGNALNRMAGRTKHPVATVASCQMQPHAITTNAQDSNGTLSGMDMPQNLQQHCFA